MEVIESYQVTDDIQDAYALFKKVYPTYTICLSGFACTCCKKQLSFIRILEGEPADAAIIRGTILIRINSKSVIHAFVNDWVNIHPDRSITITKEPE